MKLSEKQQIFTYNISKLIQYAFSKGYKLTFGEVYRTLEQQKIYLATGRSKTLNSKHLERLAVDFNIFYDDVLLFQKKEHQTEDLKLTQVLGEYWMSLNTENVWGSDWNRNHSFTDEKFQDPYHFETK